MPTVAIMSPRHVVTTDLATLVPVRLATVHRPNTISEKNSAGPKCRAYSAIGAPTKVSISTAKVPAMNEPMAAIASADPARPCIAILWPSMVVITEADSPGILTRMEVVDPPYIDP